MLLQLKKAFAFSCPRFPARIISIYQNAFLTLTIILSLSQTIIIILKSQGIVKYGSYYRIFESIGLLSLSMSSWIFCRKVPKYAYIYSGISAIVISITYFEIVIKYNEGEEGLLLYAIFSSISLVFLDFLRYYWIMILYEISMVSYVYIRVMTKRQSEIFTTYDCLFYSLISVIVSSVLFFVFTITFNIVSAEKNKAISILESWKFTMSLLPVGIIISSKTSTLFYNEEAKIIISRFHLSVCKESILSIIHNSQIITENGSNKTIKTPESHYVYYDTKTVTFEEQTADLIIINDLTKIFEGENEKHEKKMIEMLVATSTHELRTPLHCIKGTLQILNSHDGPHKDMIQRGISACEMQELYINDILDYAKVKENKLVLNKEPINISDLLYEIREYFQMQVVDRNLFIKVDLSDEQMVINADYMRLKQILFNLVSNSIKFTIEGGITLRSYKHNQKVVIQVQDTGIGISSQEIGKLFVAFGMVDSSRAINKCGTGLGLYLCKMLCNMMDGNIYVYSTESKGSVFTISLPSYSNDTLKNKNLTSCNCSSIVDKRQLNSENKVLVVDDNGFNCQILESMLKLLCIECYKAMSGHAALEMIKLKDDIKLAFVDLNMPIMDGYKLLESISKLSLKVVFPVYALTADLTEETKLKCMQCGFVGCIYKPFSKNDLKSILSSHNIL